MVTAKPGGMAKVPMAASPSKPTLEIVTGEEA